MEVYCGIDALQHLDLAQIRRGTAESTPFWGIVRRTGDKGRGRRRQRPV